MSIVMVGMVMTNNTHHFNIILVILKSIYSLWIGAFFMPKIKKRGVGNVGNIIK